MPTEAAATALEGSGSGIASRRILRLAFGTALSLWISQAIGWSISYLAPVITVFLLTMPLSRPKPRFFFVVILALAGSVYAAFAFLPLLLHAELVGLLLLSLALFHSFYFTARGGAAVVGTLITIALAFTVAVGSVSVDGLLAAAHGLVIGAAAGAAIAAFSHVVIADPARELAAAPAKAKEVTKIDAALARHHALRSLAIVLPILLWFLLTGSSASNMAVMIKVAAMGQEASKESTRDAARSLIVSTVVGGLAAIVAWQFLSIWPSLLPYALLIALAGLIFGRYIFQGEGLRPDAATWTYAFLTMILVLAPAALDGNYGSSADARFYDRLIMFGWATAYGVGAVYIFDAFWSRDNKPG